MDDQNKQELLRAMARLALDFCGADVASVTVHADVCDDVPYARVTVWGHDPDADPLWEWSDFPEEDA